MGLGGIVREESFWGLHSKHLGKCAWVGMERHATRLINFARFYASEEGEARFSCQPFLCIMLKDGQLSPYSISLVVLVLVVLALALAFALTLPCTPTPLNFGLGGIAKSAVKKLPQKGFGFHQQGCEQLYQACFSCM